MKRVTGIGGIFFRAQDPTKLGRWYEKHLGFKFDKKINGASFFWHPLGDSKTKAQTIWGPFPKNTKYFGQGRQSFMVNYRVKNLDALLKALRKARVKIDGHQEDHVYGRFAWIVDAEGNRIELWEPAKTK
jgi:predicted enzyme related to lactoylglutathione lyase